MRNTVCIIPQSLTPEATAVVKQAVSLARRRGHAQVTPLHVASAMLASSTGLLRRSCLQSHSHPLQCKALELCFNVALNRLPASTSSPLLSPHTPHPSLSNALVAAFKRAQAHQRRGSVENQQQPILALKIEVEQLIISILDDPSVSRVMREAGFSSTQVKNRVEQAVSVEVCSQAPKAPSSHPKDQSVNTSNNPKPLALGPSNVSLSLHSGLAGPLAQGNNKPAEPARANDVASVMETMMGKRRNTIVVGECVASAEAVVRGVMEKLERGHGNGSSVELTMRSPPIQILNLPILSMRNYSRDEVEQKLVELRGVVKSCVVGRSSGVVLYLGDVQGVCELWLHFVEHRRRMMMSYSYCPLEHIVMELKKWVCGGGAGEVSKRVWLLGVATLRTYMKCKAGHPSLETVWELHPLTVPAGSLSLTLNFDCDWQSEVKCKEAKEESNWSLFENFNGGHSNNNQLACCSDCMLNFDKEVQTVRNKLDSINTSSSSSLPSWLQQYKDEKTRDVVDFQQNCVSVKSLCKKWNTFCSAVHKHQPQYPEKVLKFSSTPSSPRSRSSSLHHHHHSQFSWPTLLEFKQSSPKEHQFWTPETSYDDKNDESDVKIFVPAERNNPKPDLLSNPNSSPNSASSSEVMEDMNNTDSFKEYSAENLKVLCDALEMKVPWQKDIVPEIAKTVLECRSGRRSYYSKDRKKKEETWMLFVGIDSLAKEKIARELAKTIFGSQTNFVSIGLTSFSYSAGGSDSTKHCRSKRPRTERGRGYLQRFGEAVNENPHRVFFLEDLDQADHFSQMGVKKAIEGGKVTLEDDNDDDDEVAVDLQDAIVIFSCESFSAVSRACSPTTRQKMIEDQEEEEKDDHRVDAAKPIGESLDLNVAIEEDGDQICGDGNWIMGLVDERIIFKVQEL
ncbi:protein SMAX1-LIKE 3-like isoform X1 [Rhodamnia argentea]|uniref:Protein SMAX1-LIKE 3-like isoform X1 n=1 Tax=Rhodamnia argentea TaxID=178133 RepID=A0ABM3HV89_9MYRT|nr:protein SMAX1-LIKE 3-like isoform X1 [Rhodamnia argentea]